MNANSAAVAMHRAALEQLLRDKGYQTRMLNKRIETLDAEIQAETVLFMSTDYLTAMKDLSNGAIHTHGGDVYKQASLDSRL